MKPCIYWHSRITKSTQLLFDYYSTSTRRLFAYYSGRAQENHPILTIFSQFSNNKNWPILYFTCFFLTALNPKFFQKKIPIQPDLTPPKNGEIPKMGRTFFWPFCAFSVFVFFISVVFFPGVFSFPRSVASVSVSVFGTCGVVLACCAVLWLMCCFLDGFSGAVPCPVLWFVPFPVWSHGPVPIVLSFSCLSRGGALA